MTFALPPKFENPLKYTGDNIASIPGVNFPRAPTVSDNHYPLFTIWRNSNSNAVLPDNEGDCWLLVKYQAVPPNLNAIWQKISTGSIPGGTVLSLSDTANTKVFPDFTGNIQLLAGAGITVTSNPGLNLLTIALAGGGIAIDQIGVDAFTAPGTNPVLPTGAGQINVTGAQVATGTIGANVVRTNSLAANTYTIEVQRSTAVAATDSTKNGVSHFSSTQFGVDGNGFVTLVGSGGPVLNTLQGDAGAAAIPDGAGNINLKGQNPANVSGIQTFLNGANELDITMFSPFDGNFTFITSTAGATRTLSVSNTDNTNVGSNALLNIVTGGAASGDPATTYTVTAGTNWTTGIDNSTSDQWKLSQGIALGTNDVITATTAGELNYPLQPRFLAKGGNQPNITGNGAVYTIQFTGVTFNIGAHFDGVSTFTAPVTGIYKFDIQMLVGNITAANTKLVGSLITPGGNYDFGTCLGGAVAAAGNYSLGRSFLVPMTAADTATVTILGTGEAGNTEGILQGTNDTLFSGILVA